MGWLRLSFPPWKSPLLNTTWSWPFATTHFIDILLNFFYQSFSFRTSPCPSAGSTDTEDLGSVSALPVFVKGGSRLHLLLFQVLACDSPPDLSIGVDETCTNEHRWDEDTNRRMLLRGWQMLDFAKRRMTEGTTLTLSVPGGDCHHVWLSRLHLGNLPSSQHGAEQEPMCTELLSFRSGLPGSACGSVPSAIAGKEIFPRLHGVVESQRVLQGRSFPRTQPAERWVFPILPGPSCRTEAFPLYANVSTTSGELSTN